MNERGDLKPESIETSAIVEGGFNFPEMEEVERYGEALVLKMKEKIDSGAYDLIVSDEVGGRIPTLVLREIYRKRNPKKQFDTVFINGGNYKPLFDEDLDYEKRVEDILSKKRVDNILVVTEVIASGDSMARLLDLVVKKTGGHSIDVASLMYLINTDEENEFNDFFRNKYGETFIGGISSKDLGIEYVRDTQVIVGVDKKSNATLAHPVLYTDLILPEDRTNTDSLKGHYENIRKARSDIHTIVQGILSKVWKEE